MSLRMHRTLSSRNLKKVKKADEERILFFSSKAFYTKCNHFTSVSSIWAAWFFSGPFKQNILVSPHISLPTSLSSPLMAVGKHNRRWKLRQSCTHIIQKLIQLLKIVHLKRIWQHLIKYLHNSYMSTFMINTFGGNLREGYEISTSRFQNAKREVEKKVWGKSFGRAFSKILCKIFYQLLPLAYKWHKKYPLIYKVRDEEIKLN